MALDACVDAFVVWLRAVGRSARTCEQYRWQVSRLARWLEAAGISSLDACSADHLVRWQAGLWEGWQAATVRQAVIAVRSWLRYAGRADLMGALQVPRVPGRVQRTLSVAEITAMLAACDRRADVLGCRDAAIISLLTDSGLRAAELVRLQVADLTYRAAMVTIKGGSVRWAYWGDGCQERIEAWLRVRSVVATGALFVSLGGCARGRGLSTRGLRSVLLAAGRRAGVAGVSPHAFRRAFACIASAAGAPDHVIMRAGRWSSLAMVAHYTAGMRAGELYDHPEWVPGFIILGV